MNDIKTPPFTDGQKEVIETTKRIANGKLICDVDDDIDEELKPCPFCGREPVYVADGKVICICGAMIKSFNDWKPFTNQEAVDRWNRRYKEQDDDQ